MSTKADNFQRLLEKRLPNVLDALRILGNLSNRGNYEFTPDQTAKIMSEINLAVHELGTKFQAGLGEPSELDPEPEPTPPPAALVELMQKPAPWGPNELGWFREDPAYTLDAWKASETDLPYDAWVKANNNADVKHVPAFLRQK